MLQRRKKIIITVVCLLCVLSISAIASAAYLNTNRDTRKAPERAAVSVELKSGYNLIYESDKVEYYYRDDRDIIAIKDKATGYIWKTGIDQPFEDDIEDAKEAVLAGDEEMQRVADKNDWTVEQLKEIAETPVQNSLNDTYLAMANSLVTVEYFDGTGSQMTMKKASSAAGKAKEGSSELKMIDGDSATNLSSTWVLEVNMKGIDLKFNVYITLGDDGHINYRIPHEEMEGEGLDVLSTISLTPFMGASGGELLYYNAEEEKWSQSTGTQVTPGYVLVPDGSGALIRFTTNQVKYTSYVGDVYGADPAEDDQYYSRADDAVPVQDPVMPVFGISQGDGTQSAFVAYADEGDEYMQIIAVPESEEKNQVRFTYAYATFQYNFDYFEVTTQAGATYRKHRDKMNRFDIDITYAFMYGDGSNGEPKADYTGMAKVYRDHLIEIGELTVADYSYDNIPIRIDFLMSDSKKGIVGTTPVTMTTTDDVDNILSSLKANGISNIYSGLIGWQKNGETLSKPYKAKYSSKVGSKKDFKKLITKYEDQGIHIALSRDFSTINESMVDYYSNAAKHNNTQYMEVIKSNILPENSPVTEFAYAIPKKSADWVTELFDDVKDFSNSFTINGISDTLVSTHSSNGKETTVTRAIEMYQEAVEGVVNDGKKVNMENPNAYFWKYVDRYLDSPVGTSQYVYETDTVPFLQMVLHGTMEMYAPYSNFSFYSQADMLRMIDYNISPSFVLTEQPSYLLASTVSSDYYSTEYDQYSELIQSIYKTVNGTLSQVIGYEWTGRSVLEDGVIMNTYASNDGTKSIIINYTADNYDFNGTRVDANSAKVIEGGTN